MKYIQFKQKLLKSEYTCSLKKKKEKNTKEEKYSGISIAKQQLHCHSENLIPLMSYMKRNVCILASVCCMEFCLFRMRPMLEKWKVLTTKKWYKLAVPAVASTHHSYAAATCFLLPGCVLPRSISPDWILTGFEPETMQKQTVL